MLLLIKVECEPLEAQNVCLEHTHGKITHSIGLVRKPRCGEESIFEKKKRKNGKSFKTCLKYFFFI